MAYKLVDQILKNKTVPGKYKKTLAGWASFARKDGSNIFASKEAAAERAGVSRWTMYRHTDVFIDKGLLVPEGTHSYPNGHWTTIYRLEMEALKKAVWIEADDAEAVLPETTDHRSKKPHRHCSKTPKSHRSKKAKTSVAKGDAKGDIETVASLPDIHEASAPIPAWNESKEVSQSGADSLRSSSDARPFLAGRSGDAAALAGTGTSPALVQVLTSAPVSYLTDRMKALGLTEPITTDSEYWKSNEVRYRSLFSVFPHVTVPDGEMVAFIEVCHACLGWYNTPDSHPVDVLMAWAKKVKKGYLAIRNATVLNKAFFSDNLNSLRRQFEQYLTQRYGDVCPICNHFPSSCRCISGGLVTKQQQAMLDALGITIEQALGMKDDHIWVVLEWFLDEGKKRGKDSNKMRNHFLTNYLEVRLQYQAETSRELPEWEPTPETKRQKRNFELEADEDYEPKPQPVVADMREWTEDRFGVSGERLRNCIIFLLDYAKSDWLKSDPPTITSMNRENFVRMLDANTPPGWTKMKAEKEKAERDERHLPEYKKSKYSLVAKMKANKLRDELKSHQGQQTNPASE